MQFTIPTSILQQPLDAVVNVIDRGTTLPIAANVLLKIVNNQLSITATNLQVEMTSRKKLTVDLPDFQTTLPGHKLHEICSKLQGDSNLSCTQEEDTFFLRSGKFTGTLKTQTSESFPLMENAPGESSLGFQLSTENMYKLLDLCSYAMAVQDVRYFLNGMLFEIESEGITAVSTDGHRLAKATTSEEVRVTKPGKCIIPRRGILELARVLSKASNKVEVKANSNNLQAHIGNLDFQCKLIEGDFPNYKSAIPTTPQNTMLVDTAKLIEALERTLVLSNEKPKGVNLVFEPEKLSLQASNNQGEKANDELPATYQGMTATIGFNADYLLAVLRKIKTEKTRISFNNPNESSRFEGEGNEDSLAVIMPMKV